LELVPVNLEFGIIKYFDCKRGFGILTGTDRTGAPSGEEILFHVTGARNLLIHQETVSFADERLRLRKSMLWLRSGEGIVFESVLTPRGKRAEHWAFRSELNDLTDDMGDEYSEFEAVTYVTPTNERVVVWCGLNRYQLSLQFPRDIYDHLRFEVTYGDYYTEEDWDGDVHYQYDEWTDTMDDPRVALCCIPSVYWQLHGPLGVSQPRCTHGK
jgi:cold shock CspA family protein